jgi:hypothetical protein
VSEGSWGAAARGPVPPLPLDQLGFVCKTDTWGSRMLYHYSRALSSWSPASVLRLGPQLCLPSTIAATLPCATHSCTPQRCSPLHERDGNRVGQAARVVGHQAPHLRARAAPDA